MATASLHGSSSHRSSSIQSEPPRGTAIVLGADKGEESAFWRDIYERIRGRSQRFGKAQLAIGFDRFLKEGGMKWKLTVLRAIAG